MRREQEGLGGRKDSRRRRDDAMEESFKAWLASLAKLEKAKGRRSDSDKDAAREDISMGASSLALHHPSIDP